MGQKGTLAPSSWDTANARAVFPVPGAPTNNSALPENFRDLMRSTTTPHAFLKIYISLLKRKRKKPIDLPPVHLFDRWILLRRLMQILRVSNLSLLYENAALYVKSVQMVPSVVKARYELAPTSKLMRMWPSSSYAFKKEKFGTSGTCSHGLPLNKSIPPAADPNLSIMAKLWPIALRQS